MIVSTKYLFENFPTYLKGFPNSSVGKESTCNAGDPSLIPGLGRSPGEGKVAQSVRLFVTPWTSQSVEFSRPEYWGG